MPKGKKKGKFEHKRTEQAYSSDEDAGIDMTVDDHSETSTSDLRSNHDDAENDIQEKLEEKVMETIDALGARSNIARAAAFVSLRSMLQRRHLVHVLTNHRATLADHVVKALRRGKDGEKRAAAVISPLLALQIGEEGSEEFVREVRPALLAACLDKTATLDTRAECCSSLAALCYLLEEDLSEILEVMRGLETIFSGSYLKGDGSVKVSGTVIAEAALHSSAIDAWALLLTALSPQHAASLLAVQPPFHKLTQLLDNANLEVRMAGGGALAIAYERITDGEDATEMDKQIEKVLPRLDELTKESHKYRAKKDRKLQRATFRDIMKYFEEGEIATLSIRIGTETATFDTWSGRAAYSCLAGSLGAGLQTLVPYCDALRDALGMGEPPLLNEPKSKMNKLQRHLQNTAACKARTVARNKNRDKRSAALSL